MTPDAVACRVGRTQSEVIPVLVAFINAQTGEFGRSSWSSGRRLQGLLRLLLCQIKVAHQRLMELLLA